MAQLSETTPLLVTRPPTLNNLLATTYRYPDLPLNPHRTEIRLLYLHPSLFSSGKLSGKLKTTPLYGAAPYEALSYTWGKRDLGKAIRITNGRACDIPVTDNLHKALRRLRYRRRERVLWVDAICIDQNDQEERSQQVSLMGDVYHLAWRVCVWLGDVSSGILMQRMLLCIVALMLRSWMYLRDAVPKSKGNRSNTDLGRTAPTQIQVDWSAGISEYLAQWKDDIQDQMLETALQGVQPKWHTRSWVYQELGNATRVLWCFGVVHREMTAPALSLRLASRRLICGTLPPAIDAFSRALDQIAPASTGPSFRTLSLTKHVGKTRMLVSSDPRDRLYSLLSVTADREAQIIRPDYYRPCRQVFAEATYGSIAGSGSMDILRFAICKRMTSEAGDELPTWAADFAGSSKPWPRWPAARPRYDGDAGPRPGSLPPATPLLSLDRKKLSVDGIVIDRVKSIVPCLKIATSGLRHSLEIPSRLDKPDLCNCLFGARLSSENRTALGKALRPHRRICDKYQHDLLCKDCPGYVSCTENDKLSMQYSWYYEVIYPAFAFSGLAHRLELATCADGDATYVVVYRDIEPGSAEEAGNFDIVPSLFETESNFLGGIFSEIRSGDTIALLAGAKMPVLLRPATDGFEFLGFTFLGGVLDGQFEEFWAENAADVRSITLC